MDIVYILLSLLIGFLLLGLLFGTTIVLSNKTKMSSSFCMAIFSVIPTVIMLLATDTNIFKFEYLFDYLSWIILISTDVIVCRNIMHFSKLNDLVLRNRRSSSDNESED